MNLGRNPYVKNYDKNVGGINGSILKEIFNGSSDEYPDETQKELWRNPWCSLRINSWKNPEKILDGNPREILEGVSDEIPGKKNLKGFLMKYLKESGDDIQEEYWDKFLKESREETTKVLRQK